MLAGANPAGAAGPIFNGAAAGGAAWRANSAKFTTARWVATPGMPDSLSAVPAECAFTQRSPPANEARTNRFIFMFIHSHKGARQPNLARKVKKFGPRMARMGTDIWLVSS